MPTIIPIIVIFTIIAGALMIIPLFFGFLISHPVLSSLIITAIIVLVAKKRGYRLRS